MSTRKIQGITIVMAVWISIAIKQLVTGEYTFRISPYMLFLFFLIQEVLELAVNKVRVSKLGKCLEKVEWSDNTSRHPVLFYWVLFTLGLIVSFLVPTERILLIAVYFWGIMGVIEWLKQRKPMQIYKEGIYVNGYFARYEEIEIEKGDGYVDIKIPFSLFGKLEATVSGKEDIEKLERVVDIEGV